ncbi:Discoidin domain-containing receptor 2 [Paragonimus heterotremus]|uniref:Discoidin domain-containing receptor 2 n=1 Tax=Paragonimus heterotremus TaxID=100268 RepID=A0A8J4WT33_9TREM|nr:Discoidin domain-containing receptor 2 [Paragonimus heterotremus]
MLYWTSLFVIFSASEFTQGFKPETIVRRGPGSEQQCMSPLVSSHDEFPDSALSASSVLLNKTDFQPYQARLSEVYGSREHTSGYAWCPNSNVGEMLREWIQAEFSDLVMIKSIFTAGRGDGNVKEFMPNFVLKYQREDDGAWYEHVKRDGTRVLKANSDPRNLARATLDSIIIAKRIRIYPYSPKVNQKVCLRFALYGCKFPDGVVTYSIPQGGLPQRGTLFHPHPGDLSLDQTVVQQLKDLSYDGQLIGTTYQLTDGLGQLMDNVAYLGNLTRESDLYPSQPGFHFVGWHQSSQSNVQILFKFDTTRSFTWLRLFTFDSIPLRVRLFSNATISFSLDGIKYGESLEFSTRRVSFLDSQSDELTRYRRGSQSDQVAAKHRTPSVRTHAYSEYDGAVVVELALDERIGRYVRLSLTTGIDNWIVLSEVQFNSTTVKVNSAPSITTTASDIVAGLITPTVESSEQESLSNRLPVAITSQANTDGGQKRTMAKSEEHLREKGVHSAEESTITVDDYISANRKLNIALPIIIAISILLLSLPTVLFIWFCSRRYHKRSRLHCPQKFHSTDGGHGYILQSGHPTVSPNMIAQQESTKLLRSYPTHSPTTLQDVTSIPTTQVCFSNGSTIGNVLKLAGEVNGFVNSTVGNNQIQSVQLPSVRLGVTTTTMSPTGVILTCSPSSSCCSADRLAPVPTVSTLTTSVPPGSFATTPEMSNVFPETDFHCMSGVYSLPPQASLPCYVPTFIALPASHLNGAFVLQPINCTHPNTVLSNLHILGGLGTPDSSSLYTSIRASAIQSGQRTQSEGESVGYDKTCPTSPQTPPKKEELLIKTHPSGEDTDEDLADLNEEIVDNGVVYTKKDNNVVVVKHEKDNEKKSNKTDDLSGQVVSKDTLNNGEDDPIVVSLKPSVCSELPNVRYKRSDSSQYVLESLQSPTRNSDRRHSCQPVSSTHLPHRHSGLSLPDGEDSSSTNLRRLSREAFSVYLPAVLPIYPYGPEYASASIFEYSSTTPESPMSPPPTCTESMPATNYRPVLPTYTVSFAQPIPGLASVTSSIYTGPASLPMSATTLRPVSKHATPNPVHRLHSSVGPQAAGLLFLPQTNLETLRSNDQNLIYQAIPSNKYGFLPEVGRHCNLYQADQRNTYQGHMQQICDKNENSQGSRDPWLLPATNNRNSMNPQLDPRKAVWNPETRNICAFPTQMGLPGTVHPTFSGMVDLTHNSPQVSPQHFIPTPLVFSTIPPKSHQEQPPQTRQYQQLTAVEFTGDHHISQQQQLSYHRGSPVGAAGSTSYILDANDRSNRDGANSGCVSIYSKCG